MHFTLHYQGALHANAKPKEKHKIRLHFHAQIARLVDSIPSLKHLYLDDCQYCSYKEAALEGVTFRPIVNEDDSQVCELSITLLRPEPPGRIITRSGDIDNRMKTLFDALSMPPHANQLPKEAAIDHEEPIYCLLEDDNLISSVSIHTDTWWTKPNSASDVVLLLRVSIEKIHGDHHTF